MLFSSLGALSPPIGRQTPACIVVDTSVCVRERTRLYAITGRRVGAFICGGGGGSGCVLNANNAHTHPVFFEEAVTPSVATHTHTHTDCDITNESRPE